MLSVLKQRYYWPTMVPDVTDYVRKCPPCEQRSAGFAGKAPVQENYQATRPFQKMSIDFMTGLPPTDRGNTVLLTAICCFTRWVELIPLPDRSAKGVAEALTRRIFSDMAVAKSCQILAKNSLARSCHKYIGYWASTPAQTRFITRPARAR